MIFDAYVTFMSCVCVSHWIYPFSFPHIDKKFFSLQYDADTIKGAKLSKFDM